MIDATILSIARQDYDVCQGNVFRTRMRLKDLALDDQIFGGGGEVLNTSQKRKIIRQVEHEIMEIFSGRNLPKR